MTYQEHYECLACSLKYCEPSCFDKHVGSQIALGKLINYMNDKEGVKVYIVRSDL